MLATLLLLAACSPQTEYTHAIPKNASVVLGMEMDEMAKKAHDTSIAIHHRLMEEGKPGVPACRLYEIAMEMTKEAGLEDYFMGHKQKAGYIGHGVGIEINEAPVIAPRSRETLVVGNVIALEPKYVIPHVGAVGVESTYVVTENGLECITNYPYCIQTNEGNISKPHLIF